jgi:hypothetical protein
MLGFFKYLRRKIRRKNWRFLPKTKINYSKILIITLDFKKKRHFFRRKLAEISDHSIDPRVTRLGEFLPVG